MRVGLVAAVLFAVSSVASAQAVLARLGSDGKVRFQAVDELRINANRKIRLAPANTTNFNPNDVKRYSRGDMASVGLVQKDANRRLVVMAATGKPGELIVPDNFAPKDTMDAAGGPGPVTIEGYSKESKKSEPVTIDEFYMYASGSADQAALDFVVHDAYFPTPEAQIAAMEGFGASFPSSPLKDQLRTNLESRIRAGLLVFDTGGDYRECLKSRKFADLAKNSFSNATINQLHGQLLEKQKVVEDGKATLYSLAYSEDWDTLLEKYVAFEPYQWSFPEFIRLRERAIDESARAHGRRGRQFSTRQEYAVALQETSASLGRDPDNAILVKLVDDQKVLNSRNEARRRAASRVAPPKDSPEEVRFKRVLYVADRAIQDKDFPQAEKSIREAMAENAASPEILLLQARLLAALDRHAEALPLLDNYDRMVADTAERDRGETIRNQLLYDLDKKKKAAKEGIAKLLKDGEYSKLYRAIGAALKLDSADDDFLYYGGALGSLLRRNDEAKSLLTRYLAQSNSVRGDIHKRDKARRILAMTGQAAAAAKPRGYPNWLSGRMLSEGVYYCPESGAFQLPVESVTGPKFHMDFKWEGSRLRSVASTFEDDRSLKSYKALADTAGGLLKQDEEAPGNFYFSYTGTNQILSVEPKRPAAAASANGDIRILRGANGVVRVVLEPDRPRLLFKNDSQINTDVLSVLEGPVATGFSGSGVFNPFVWDGFHYFSLQYDREGRLSEAREWNADNLVRFTWSGEQLTEVRAFRSGSGEPYYQRSISYTGTDLAGETYSAGGKSGKIKYVYAGKNLQQVRVEDGGVHDGKTWIVRLRG